MFLYYNRRNKPKEEIVMKKLFTFIALMGGAFTLSGCELNNQEMENIISKCKEDTECKAILDREIDEALEERGIFGYDAEGYDDYDVFYELELTEDELELLETLESLDMEVWTVLDSMSDEDLEALEIQELESFIGRELTQVEKDALEIVDALYNSVEDEYDFESEIAYLEHHLGRSLTEEEIAAFNIITTLEESFIDDEAGATQTLTPEQEAAFNVIDALYEESFMYDEMENLTTLLGRELTTEEQTALDLIDSIIWDNADFEMTEEQEAAFEIVDTLYEEAYDNYEIVELTILLGRELTEEEKAALDTVNALWDSMYVDDDDYDFEDEVNEMVLYYENILNRSLTDLEKEAVEFSLDFYFYDEFHYEDDYDDYDDDFFDFFDEDEYDEEEHDDED